MADAVHQQYLDTNIDTATCAISNFRNSLMANGFADFPWFFSAGQKSHQMKTEIQGRPRAPGGRYLAISDYPLVREDGRKLSSD